MGGKRKSEQIFVLLDKDNITNVCGRLSAEEIMECENLKSWSEFYTFLKLGRLVENKYIPVEDE